MTDQLTAAQIVSPQPNPPVPPKVKLRVKTGSRFGPILLLALMVLIFVVLNRTTGLEQLFLDLEMPIEPDTKLNFKTATKLLFANEGAAIAQAFDKFGILGMFPNVIGPYATAFANQVISDMSVIVANALETVGTLSLYSIPLGIAGLIYRRAFWTWFLIAFAVFFAFNYFADAPLTGLSGDEAMPFSGTLLIFLIGQAIFLLLANRLRRYSNTPGPFPPYIYNALLAVALVGVAYTIYEEWWPWSMLVGAGTGVYGTIYKWEFILIGLPALYILLRNSEHWNGRKPKNIVICLDGTSNTPEQQERGLLAQTNVFKLFKMLKADKDTAFVPKEFDASLCKIHEQKQIAFYYVGVGNKYDHDPLTQTLGMAAGLGAASAVERAYLDVMRVHRPGDRVFIFGFSRGAAISRLLARTIDSRGAPKTVWTIRLFGRHFTIWQSGLKRDVPVTVLGCWDTVGAFGIAKTVAGINFQKLNMFRDLSIPENVERAYHMVALDEMRDSFEPTLMDPDPIMPERIVEVWFAGDHANIGGGWATDRLSDVTMDFLLRHVSSGYASNELKQPGNEDWGLHLTAINGMKASAGETASNIMTIYPDPLGQLRSWSSVLYEYRPRKLPLHAVVSETVFERMAKATPVYAPQSLFNHNEELDNKRDTIDASVAKLVETNSLLPEEEAAILNAKDKLRLTRWPQYLQNLYQRRSVEPVEIRLANQLSDEQIAASPLRPLVDPAQPLDTGTDENRMA